MRSFRLDLPFDVLFHFLPVVWVVAVVGCRLRCMVSNVTCNVLLLPSVLAFAQNLLRALYLLYTAAPRNLSEFKRVKTDHLIVIHIGKTNQFMSV